MSNLDLLNELLAMRDLGVPVSDLALWHAAGANLREYAGTSVADLASLFCELYPIPSPSEIR